MNAYPERREIDRYDPHAIHFAATDADGTVAATLRLVLDSPLGFPVEGRGVTLFPEFDGLPRGQVGEVSRLIVAGPHRTTPAAPILLFGLFSELYAESRRLGLHGLLATMEEGLCRLLQKVGLAFRAIGEAVDYFGPVTPYWASLEALEPGYRRIITDRRRSPTRASRFRYVSVRPTGGAEDAV